MRSRKVSKVDAAEFDVVQTGTVHHVFGGRALLAIGAGIGVNAILNARSGFVHQRI